MSTQQIKANLEDAAAAWARRVEAERLAQAETQRRLTRRERTTEALIVAGVFLSLASLAGILWIYLGVK